MGTAFWELQGTKSGCGAEEDKFSTQVVSNVVTSSVETKAGLWWVYHREGVAVSSKWGQEGTFYKGLQHLEDDGLTQPDDAHVQARFRVGNVVVSRTNYEITNQLGQPRLVNWPNRQHEMALERIKEQHGGTLPSDLYHQTNHELMKMVEDLTGTRPGPRTSKATLVNRIERATLGDKRKSATAHISERPLIPRGLGTKAAVADLGFETLTEVQQETFEPICDGQDLVVRAETGGGKTLSFLLPTMDRIHQAGSPGIELLVLSPVRELSMQIHQEALKLANRFPQVQPVLMVGGSNWEDDLDALEAAEGHAVILIATPGRLQTHLSKTPSFAKRLGQVKTLVLDEVDQLAGELFAEVTEEILQQLCSASQHLFYSATVTEQVTRLIAQVSKSYTFVDALEDEMSIPESIVQTYQVVPTQDMGEALWQSVESARGFLSPPKIVVIFITGRIAAYYAEAFRQCGDLEVFEIHSRMKQQERTTQSDGFRAAASGLLFTSDITSRGLDYPGVTAVIQLGAPESRAEYVHRVGRTGRREREGLGILLLHDFEESWMAQLDGLGLKQSPPLSAPSPRFADLEIPRNVKAQAYYSRINHAMRHPEDLDVLEVFRDAFRFAGSIGHGADGYGSMG
ncbi:DEAD-box ATP-dependent RNA helicase 25 [Durusdinium trenchii]|uniref:ATP-dependent RNA helicase n=1 Tax=Durusdinium trenchii TaxID=1381693 RepID=A0ABP0II90_9DINO